jgi:hypothetical protein
VVSEDQSAERFSDRLARRANRLSISICSPG